MALRIKGVDRRSLEKEYRKLAKRADQRLVRIEGYRHQSKMKGIETFAYAGAMKRIRRWSGEGAKRFNTAPPESDKDLLRKIADIKVFLDAPTSTKQGIIAMYKEHAAQMNKNAKLFGEGKTANFTWQEYANIFDVIDTEEKDSKFRYLDVMRGARVIKQYNITKENATRALEKLVRSDDIDIVEKDIVESLYKNGIELDKLIKR